jgi:DNA processing protein
VVRSYQRAGHPHAAGTQGVDPKKKKAPVQNALFLDLMPEEQALVDVLKEKGKLGIDDLCLLSKLPQHKAAGILLNLEFNGVLHSLPGKVYQLN